MDEVMEYTHTVRRNIEKALKKKDMPGNSTTLFARITESFKIANDFKLAHCEIPKVMSTVLMNVLCYLYNYEAFNSAGRDIQSGWWTHRACEHKNEFFTFNDMHKHLPNGYNITVLVREPFTRFMSAFMNKCIGEPFDFLKGNCEACREGTCFDCDLKSSDYMDCVLTRLAENLKQVDENLNYSRRYQYELAHMSPYTWFCNMGATYKKSIFLRYYSSGYKKTKMIQQLVSVLANQNVSKDHLRVIRASLDTGATTWHATSNSKERNVYYQSYYPQNLVRNFRCSFFQFTASLGIVVLFKFLTDHPVSFDGEKSKVVGSIRGCIGRDCQRFEPLKSYVSIFKIVPEYHISYCAVEGVYEYMAENMFCYLYDSEYFQEKNTTFELNHPSERPCWRKNELTDIKDVKIQLSYKVNNLFLYQEPLLRFIIAYVRDCLMRDDSEYCFNCSKKDLTCFVMKLRHFIMYPPRVDHNDKFFLMFLKVVPQTWYCNFEETYMNSTFIQYNLPKAEREITFNKIHAYLLDNVPKHKADYVRSILQIEQKTPWIGKEIGKEYIKSKIHHTMLNDKRIENALLQIYRADIELLELKEYGAKKTILQLSSHFNDEVFSFEIKRRKIITKIEQVAYYVHIQQYFTSFIVLLFFLNMLFLYNHAYNLNQASLIRAIEEIGRYANTQV